MKRRMFLQGLGGAALAAPYLSSLAPRAARAQSEYPTNLVFYFHHNGCLLDNYRKAERTGALDLSGLSTFADLVGMENKLLQIRGTKLEPAAFSGVTYQGTKIYFDPHDQGTASKLTCAPNDNTNKWAMGVSFDHFIAGLIQPGTDPWVWSPGGVFQDVKGVLSYKVAGDGKAFSPETNPGKYYSLLTGLFVESDGSTATPTTEGDYKVLRGNSILDLTRDDLMTLQGRNMSVKDKDRLKAWAELLRSAESVVVPAGCNADVALALGLDEAAITAAGGSVGSTGGSGGNFGGGGGGFGGASEVKMTVGMEVFQKLSAVALVCGASRVVVQHNGSFVTYNFDGMTCTADHHGISHRTGSAAVGGDTYDPELYEPQIKQVDTWLGKKYAQFVKILDSVPQGDGTLLDYSGLVWLPELGDGEAHNNDDLPLTIAGSMGGYLAQGVIVDAQPASSGGSGGGFGGGAGSFGNSGAPINKLYVSLGHALGQTELMEFGIGDTDDCDAGITDPGPLDAVKAV